MTVSPWQPFLFPDLIQTRRVELDEDATLDAQFRAFDRANPHVYRALRALCLATKRRGFRQWSIKAAWELARWEVGIQTLGETFKLSNSLHSRYARKLMEHEPELAGFFELRGLRTP